MVRLTKIYTKGGDSGETSLGDGARVPKHNLRVNAYGTVDEANSIIGIARLNCDIQSNIILDNIQNDLFDIGADLCRPIKDNEKSLRVTSSQVLRLETEIDDINSRLEPLNSFILPGGSSGAAHLHHARTVVRRAERLATELSINEEVNPFVITYLNRLSDHLFVLARHLNNDGKKDVLWKPGANR
ncbi:MAG: ATP:cob(I)alamin adenosyltransferase [Alphaproteobacteria bacterium]|nr:ATP:cob(I)alamin adenosyltransferase [Alphaproteobacteria bacterium]|tara:strand:+ start:591 stop:1148 length:558 start_codon:yes stop_codon:yes gene_type:complete